MLSKTERDEIEKLVKTYRRAKYTIAKRPMSRKAYKTKEKCEDHADTWLDFMLKDGGVNVQNIVKIQYDDVKYYALIACYFGNFKKTELLDALENNTNFGVYKFLEQYNRGFFGYKTKAKSVKELSASKMDAYVKKYNALKRKSENGNDSIFVSNSLDNIYAKAYKYARDIREGRVKVSPENSKSALRFIDVICGDEGMDMDTTREILHKQIAEEKTVEQDNKKGGFFGGLKKRYEQGKAVRQQQKQEENRIRQEQERFAREDYEKINAAHKQEMELKKRKQAEKAAQKAEQKQAHIAARQQKIQDAKGKVAGFFGAVKSKFTKDKKPVVDRQTFVRGTALVFVAGLFVAAGIGMHRGANPAETKDVKPVKKEVKADVKTDVVAQNVVTLDTAYTNALKNYYNSSLDIIAGEKNKTDVIAKVENQVKLGNIALTDSVSVERVAYAYFIYRAYGLKQDILELAVNGNQKLTNEQQAEFIQVIMDAGERGTGVQKMAQQKVEARGKHLSNRNNFKNASKQQQREHLKTVFNLKNLHVK